MAAEDGDYWFGTKQRMQWVPGPSTGVQRRLRQSVEAGTLDDGGGFATRSTGGHLEFDFNFPVGVNDGLDVFQEYASGLHDDLATATDGFNRNDLIWFSDPMDWRTNLFPAGWATPILGVRKGWPLIGAYASDAATPANSNNLPARQVTFNVTTAANQWDPTKTVVIPIPPGHTLRWHARGARTGTGVIRAVAHHAAGGSDLVQSVTPVAVTSTTRIGNAIDGDTYDYVEIGLARTSGSSSTVTPAGMVAQIHANAVTPSTTGPHIAGRGHTGCVFLPDAVAEDYYLADNTGGRHLKGLSFGLKEVGAWL